MGIDQHDIQQSILELQGKRSKLGLRKQQIQSELNKIREMFKYVQQGHETFNDLVDKKKGLIDEANSIELELADLKNQVKRRQALKDEVTPIKQPKLIMLEAELTALRDRYLNFAGDKTRIASMRAMSAEFAEELTKLIKKSKTM